MQIFLLVLQCINILAQQNIVGKVEHLMNVALNITEYTVPNTVCFEVSLINWIFQTELVTEGQLGDL